MESNFSERVEFIVLYSKDEATRLHSLYICPEHLLLGIIKEGTGKAIYILNQSGANLNEIKNTIESSLMVSEESDSTDILISKEVDKTLRISLLEARKQQAVKADSEHLLLALVKDENSIVAKILKKYDISYKSLYEQITSSDSDLNESNINPQMGAGFTDDDDEDEQDDDNKYFHDSGKQSFSNKETNDTPVLDNFGTDMTKAAEEGRLDPVVGREKEIERLAQILSRRKKNNPVLIGEPGVGKSAIVEGQIGRAHV